VEPARLDGEVHPVPLVAAVGFGSVALLGVGIIVFSDGGLIVGVVIATIFGVLGTLFALECIPPWVELDDAGIRYRVKVRVGSVAWNEIAALGTGRENEENPGTLLVRLTRAACEKRGLARVDNMYHLEVPAVPTCRQSELLELAVEHWESHGGSGETFTLMGALLQSVKDLRKIATDLVEIERRANPGVAAFLDEMREARAESRAEAAETSAPVEGDDVYCSILHVRNPEGGIFFCIIAGSDRLDALTSTIRSTAERLAREHRFNPEFGGKMQVSLVPDLTPKTKALEKRMNELVDDLESSLDKAGLGATGGQAIRISWAHGHPPKPDTAN
jgi:hypothetical protein